MRLWMFRSTYYLWIRAASGTSAEVLRELKHHPAIGLACVPRYGAAGGDEGNKDRNAGGAAAWLDSSAARSSYPPSPCKNPPVPPADRARQVLNQSFMQPPWKAPPPGGCLPVFSAVQKAAQDWNEHGKHSTHVTPRTKEKAPPPHMYHIHHWLRGAPDNQGGGSSPGDSDRNADGNGEPAGVSAADSGDNAMKAIEDWAAFVDSVRDAIKGQPRHAPASPQFQPQHVGSELPPDVVQVLNRELPALPLKLTFITFP